MNNCFWSYKCRRHFYFCYLAEVVPSIFNHSLSPSVIQPNMVGGRWEKEIGLYYHARNA